MTLSLDEVRNIRFPMVRKPDQDGYLASAVDSIMDQLEISYAELTDEIERLRANQASQGSGADNEQLKAELDSLRTSRDQLDNEANQLRSANEALQAENGRCSEELNQLRGQLDQLRASSGGAATGGEQLSSENEQLRGELDQLRAANQQLQTQLANTTQPSDSEHTAAEITSSQLGVVSDGVRHIEVTTSQEASPAVVRLVELATEQAETLVTDAKTEAKRLVDEANAQAEQTVTEARNNADRTTAEAQATADKLVSDANNESDRVGNQARDDAERLLADARGRAERLDTEVKNRRAELFSQLESERDVLARRVTNLRNYEGSYREAMTNHLRSQMEALDNLEVAQGDEPNTNAMFGLGQPEVSTPRLDALLAESRLDAPKGE